MERSQNWCDLSTRQEAREEPSRENKIEDEAQNEEEEENPYTFAETDDNEYDLILASKSVKKRTGNRSFIVNRPPAPTPRPTHVPFKEETTPYIAQGNGLMSKDFFNVQILCAWMFYLYACLCAVCTPGTQRPEKGTGCPGNRITENYKVLCGCWYLILGSLKEPPVIFATETCSQPQFLECFLFHGL